MVFHILTTKTPHLISATEPNLEKAPLSKHSAGLPFFSLTTVSPLCFPWSKKAAGLFY